MDENVMHVIVIDEKERNLKDSQEEILSIFCNHIEEFLPITNLDLSALEVLFITVKNRDNKVFGIVQIPIDDNLWNGDIVNVSDTDENEFK